MAKKFDVPVGAAVSTGEPMVKIKLPRTKDLREDVFVGINERTWLIQRGVEVEVPACVAEVLMRSESQMEENIKNLPDD